jgi:release factor glutamine methyltransferase
MTEPELLFTELLGCTRSSLYVKKDERLTPQVCRQIAAVLRRRIMLEPIQYILGTTEFMGLEFKVNEDVLIPRPETERLVETAMVYAQRCLSQPPRVLDVGTGSGAIAVSLAVHLPGLCVDATDISPRALKIAQENAAAHRANIRFMHSDLFQNPDVAAATYEIIVANPPYIVSNEVESLQPEVRHEPRLALDGGTDGLDVFRRLIAEAPEHLTAGGCLIMEMGFNQRKALESLIYRSGVFSISEIVQDYLGYDRVLVAEKNG